MTIFDDPNREAVGLDPIWTEAENPPEIEPPGYDPATHTVAEVQSYVTEHPEERAAVLAAEKAGKARTSLLDWLAAP